jgi:hypothetical protein
MAERKERIGAVNRTIKDLERERGGLVPPG